MNNVWTIYRREFSAYFNSPIATIFILVFLVVMAFLFFVFYRFFSQPNPDLRSYFEILPLAFFIFIPAITMRLWSEEKRQGTIEMLMTLPVNSWEVVAGKFLAAYTIIGISLLLTVSVPISAAFVLDNMDGTALIANYVGAFLVAGVYIAIGGWISACTENQVVAFVLSVVACFLVCFMGWPNVIDWINRNLWDGLGRIVGYFGVFFHYQKFAQGQVSAVNVVYALSMIGLFLGLNNFAVESRKY
jgi:ABC-2 type transport system permease protein